jgi:hypothetical protein
MTRKANKHQALYDLQWVILYPNFENDSRYYLR